MLHAVIMAGGGGTRFWPRSRAQRPKQFLKLGDERTLLQQSLERIEAVVSPERTLIITGQAYRAEAARQAAQVPQANVIGEPCGRDTAACIALGAALVARQDAAGTVIVTPADHRIEPAQEFRRAVQVAVQVAEDSPQSLVTLGITPTYPATGYGYIQRGAELARRQGIRVFRVQRFREKPDAASAAQMIATGEYFWNAGIFVWKAATILDSLKENQPAIHAGIERIADAWATPERERVFEREYQALPRLSIDFAVMEKAKDVLVVEAPFQWDDVGSWLALERMSPQDAGGNTILARHCGLRTQNCIIVGDAARLITTVGVENLIIIQDGDAILVANRKDEGNIKQLVELLKKNGMDAYL